MVGVVIQHPGAAPAAKPRLRGRLGSSSHEQRVARIALRLFDLLSSEHSLGRKYRSILRTGALLHDCARRYGAADHHVRGAALVMEDRALRLSAWQRRCVAYLVRYHRGKVPRSSQSEILEPGDGRRKLRILLGFLRAADGLDSRRISATAIIARRKSQRVRIKCLVSEPVEEAQHRLARPRKFRLLERTLKLSVDARVEPVLDDLTIP